MAAQGSRWWYGRCVLLLTAACWGDIDVVDGLAIKLTRYVDDTCEVEMAHNLMFGASTWDLAGKQTSIGECD